MCPKTTLVSSMKMYLRLAKMWSVLLGASLATHPQVGPAVALAGMLTST